jgi:serine/threonine-protein kinase SRPK3
MLDKWAFGMSKIAGHEIPSKSPSVEKGLSSLTQRAMSTDLVAEVGNVSLDTRAGFVGRGAGHQPGPSLLSVTKPPSLSNSGILGDGDPTLSMFIDQQSDDSSSSYTEAPVSEKITVKIADLGNGASLCNF